MSNSIFAVYVNRFGEVKPYEIEVIEHGDTYTDVFDMREEIVKTFKTKNILLTLPTFDEAAVEAEVLQAEVLTQPRNKTGVVRANHQNKFEVCFTGFAKAEKQELISLAEQQQMFVRTKVTKNLGLLVCGTKAGWSKIREANKMEIPRVFGIDGFHQFIETGEFAE